MIAINRRRFGLLAGAAAGTFAAGPAFAETTLEKIKRTGTLTVGTEAAFPPFEFVQDGKIVGYGSDLLAEIVKALGGPKLNQLDLPWQGILPGVLAGKFDFVATTVGINEERAKRYAYTMPIANGEPYAMMRKGEKMTKIEDLNGKVVATQLASSTEPVAKALNDRLKAAGGAGFKDLKLFTAFTETYVALASGEVDAVIQGLPSLAVLVKEKPDTFTLLASAAAPGGFTYLSWVTRPDGKELRDFISGVIKTMRDDGRLYRLQEKWFGFKMEIPDSGYLPPGAVWAPEEPGARTMTFQFAYLWGVLPSLLPAALVNLRLAAIVVVLALAGGTALTLLRSLKIAPVNGAIAVLISFIRGTPLLIQIFLCFYVLPALGIDLSPEAAGILAISVNSSIFITEMMRGALLTIDPGQIEAATSLALPRRLVWAKVVLPQLFRRILPILVNETTVIVKGTALLSVITVVDVLRRAQQIASSSYRPFETLVAAALVFLAINVAVGTAGQIAEARLAARRS